MNIIKPQIKFCKSCGKPLSEEEKMNGKEYCNNCLSGRML